jgi:iron complex outermembrane receptor protein
MNTEPNRNACCVVAIAASLGFVPAAAAQAVVPENTDIIVTAQRRAERLQDVPVAVTAQSAAQLQSANITNARDLTLVTPGLRIEANGVNAQPALRGVSSTLGSSNAENNVATYVDGIYQPTIIGAFFSLPDVAQVQVLKGPQGSLYGRNATGGVILINSKSPSFTPQMDLGLSYGHFGRGSDGEVKANAFVTGPIIDNLLAASVTVSSEYTSSYVRNVATGRNERASSSRFARAKLLLTPSSTLKIEGAFTYNDNYNALDMAYTSFRGGNALAALPGVIVGSQPWTTSTDIAGRTHTDYKGYSLKADLDTSVGTFTSVTGYVDFVAPIRQEADYTNLPLGFYDITSYSRSFSQDLYFTSDPFGPFSLIAGGSFYRRNVGDIPAFINIPGFGYVDHIYDHSINKSLSGFFELTWKVTDRLKVIGGGRYTHDDIKGYANGFDNSTPEAFLGRVKSNKFTPRAAVMFDLTDSLNIYYNYAQGFKAGLFNTIARQTTPVLPEELISHEIGAKFSSAMLTLNASAFHYDYKDLQVTTTANGVVSTLLNAASATIYGLDADATLRPTDDLSLTLGGSYLHARYDQFANASVVDPAIGNRADLSGQRMIRAPKFTLNGVADYHHDFDAGRLNLSVNGYYSTRVQMALEERISQKAYFVGNARVAWTPKDSGFTGALFVRNFTNAKVVGSTFINPSADAVIYNPPRQIGIAFNYSY